MSSATLAPVAADQVSPECRRSWNRRSSRPTIERARSHAALRDRLDASTTNASGVWPTQPSKCRLSGSMTWGGMVTVRRPARVFGSLTMVRPPIEVVFVMLTESVPRSRSMSQRRRPRTSPRRSWHQAARRTAIRRLAGMARVRASTSAMVATGRSGAFSTAAPRTWHGFRVMSSSDTAVRMMEDRSRYALAAVVGWIRAAEAYQARTSGGSISSRLLLANVGSMCRSRSHRYSSSVRSARSMRHRNQSAAYSPNPTLLASDSRFAPSTRG